MDPNNETNKSTSSLPTLDEEEEVHHSTPTTRTPSTTTLPSSSTTDTYAPSSSRSYEALFQPSGGSSHNRRSSSGTGTGNATWSSEEMRVMKKTKPSPFGRRSMSSNIEGPTGGFRRPDIVRRSVSAGDNDAAQQGGSSSSSDFFQSPSLSLSSTSSRTKLPSSIGAKVTKRSQDIKGLLFGRYAPNLVDMDLSSSNHSVIGAGGDASSFHNSDNNSSLQGSNHIGTSLHSRGSISYRGYKVGENVLVQTHHRFPSCVNRFGFPPGEGNGRSMEERSGPYLFVLGKVQQIHYEENSVFYTVRREDTGVDVRGDAAFMEPLMTKEGEDAARKAAEAFAFGDTFLKEEMGGTSNYRSVHGNRDDGMEQKQENCFCSWMEDICVFLLLPFFWLYDCFVYVAGARLYRCFASSFRVLQTQSYLFLNGMKPYSCSMRITTTNIVVLCSIWYIFIDSIRLAFIPGKFDYTLAVISSTVWVILLLELILAYFIRPDGYHTMIQSDKAYTPTMVRFISGVHLFVELISLGFFVPEFYCLFDSNLQCDDRPEFSFFHSTLLTVTGPTLFHAFLGRAFYACIRLRVFGLIRHWKNMWVNQKFMKRGSQKSRHYYYGPQDPQATSKNSVDRSWNSYNLDNTENSNNDHFNNPNNNNINSTTKSIKFAGDFSQKQGVASLSNIRIALMVTNSYRALSILCIIMGIFPMISLIAFCNVANPVTLDMVEQLQETNWMAWQQQQNDTAASCEFLGTSVQAWVNSWEYMNSNSITTSNDKFLIDLVISPSRCIEEFESMPLKDIVVEPNVKCQNLQPFYPIEEDTLQDDSYCLHFALNKTGDFRLGNIEYQYSSVDHSESSTDTVFVAAQFNRTRATENSAFSSFLLQLCLVLTVIASLILLRKDASNYVLGPLRSMLKIVARYAKNPLQATSGINKDYSVLSGADSEAYIDDDDDEISQSMEFQTDETEQLIRAVAKITDLLRKCWGVAGAGIISTNLASRETALAEVFNPTVPGKSVYAVFAFAAIKGFDHCLRSLGGDVMILINDVANVLHREVFRWGFEDSGQCNKNLGEAFLMVFRIGLVKEVLEKLDEATKVVFSTNDSKKMTVKKRNIRRDNDPSDKMQQRLRKPTKSQRMKSHDTIADAMQLSLQSLPGISTFTDRALIGMLKSFAGIHRDKKLMTYSRDFRLSAGVGAFSVNMVFGMDAGWAVEGAVGSEYKIDATYLSPHVNMASRMMSACKHYGVTILLSEAVQELMSDVAKSKLRSVDRVTVKGSTWVQKIYTYDARHKGADFFLFGRSDQLADLDAERYVANIWNTDQDLKAMRHHVTDDFVSEFNDGMKAYLAGDWPAAITNFEAANEIMVDTAMEEGYLLDETDTHPERQDFLRSECADGPSHYLINFMKSHGGVAPKGWNGWHQLLSK